MLRRADLPDRWLGGCQPSLPDSGYGAAAADPCALSTYSCCASRKVSVLSPATNSSPLNPGTMVRKEIVPSGFLREATSLDHSPKLKIVAGPFRLTTMPPTAG